jgi:hypothetical protein
MTDLFEQRLRNAARSLPVPSAPPELIERVIAERAAGHRAPGSPNTPMLGRRRALRITAVAAGIIIVGTLLTARTVAKKITPARITDSASSLERLFASSGVGPATAYAQTPPPAPGAPPITGMNGLLLGGRRFQLVSRDGDIRVVPDSVDRIPAWRVEHLARLTSSAGQTRVEGETLLVRRDDLRLLRRVVHQTPYLRFSRITIRQRFVGDSVLGEMSTDNGIRRPIAQLLSPVFGPFISDALAPLALVGVPLSAQWRGSASVVGWAVLPHDVFFPATLWVVGEERLTTPAGTFDCWKVQVVSGAEKRLQWVRKSDGIALRSTELAGAAGAGRREFIFSPSTR